MEEAYSALTGGLTPIVVAPTGYGKTMASPEMYRRASDEGLAGGLIHVVPLRSLVRRIYDDLFKPMNGGYQMHDPTPGEGKSPYFLRSLVVTSLDSYLWNLYRIPVMEASVIERRLSMGHYYPIYSSIYTSINVFDEAHLYMGHGEPGKVVEAVEAAIAILAGAGAYLVVETATLRPSILGRMAWTITSAGGKPVVYTLPCYASKLIEALDSNIKVKGVDDEEWMLRNEIPWDTSITDSWDNVLGEITKQSEEGPVLVVANTVDGAVELYRKLSSMLPGDHISLIHGRLSEADRKRAEKRITGAERGVIIATQVIEAGVDVNSIAVYTEVAPVENLVQRIGRACRRGRQLDYCKSSGARVVIVKGNGSGIYDEREVTRAVNLVEENLENGIDWRIPCKTTEATPYTAIIEAIDKAASQREALGSTLARMILKEYLGRDGRPDSLLELLDQQGLCGLFRDTSMVQVDTQAGPVTVSLEWALNNAGILERGDSGAPIIHAYRMEGEALEPIGMVPAERLWSKWRQSRGRLACRVLLGELRRDLEALLKTLDKPSSRIVWRFKALPNAYEEGIGLHASTQL